MKKFIIIALIIVGMGAISFTLYDNKKEINAEAEASMRKSKAIPVKVEAAQYESVSYNFTASGTFIPAHVIDLVSEAQGSIVKIYREKGDKVASGQIIAKVDDTLLQAQLMVAQGNFDKAKRDLERFDNLAGTEAITQRQLEDAKLAYTNAESNLITIKKKIADTNIKSPITGIVNDDFIEPGAFLSVGAPVAEIVAVHPLKLDLKVSENEVAMISIDDSVQVYTGIDPQNSYEGIVTFVAAKGDESLKYAVEVTLEKNAAEKLKPGMYGYADFSYDLDDNSLVINKKAIVGSLEDPKVYVAEGKTAKLKPIKIMPIDEQRVRVFSGLKEGEKVVVSGQINLTDGREISVL